MRPFRSLLLRRLVATALVAAVSVSLAPLASAQSGRLATLRGMLDDARAFEAGLEAARHAGSAPLLAFAHAYAAESQDGTTAAAVAQLLGANALRGVLPPAPDRASPAPEAATSGASGSLCVLVGHASPPAAARSQASASDPPAGDRRPGGTAAQPRAP